MLKKQIESTRKSKKKLKSRSVVGSRYIQSVKIILSARIDCAGY